MPGFWESLGQGLETAGGILSPDVYGANQTQRRDALQRAFANQQLSAKAIMEGIQSGAIDPVAGQQALSRFGFGGVPIAPSMEAQLNRQALDYFGGGGGRGEAPPGTGLGGGGGLGGLPSGMPPAVAMSPFGRAITQQRAAEALIAQRERPRMSLNVDNYTPESVATYRRSGDYADLVPKDKPGQDTPFLKELRAAGIDPASPEGQRYIRRRLDRETAPTATQTAATDTPLGSDPDFWYEYYAKTRTLPPISWGTAGNPTRQAFIEGFPKWQKAHGGAAATTAASQAEFHADAGALNAVTKDLNTFEPYKKMLDTNADIAISLGRKIAQTDARLANRTLNWFRQNASSNPDVAEYLAQMRFVQTEAARVINNPRIVGQLTDESRREMDAVITGDAPIAVVDRVLNRLKTDGSNRFDAMRSQQGEIIAKMKGPGTAAPAWTPEDERRLRELEEKASGAK